MSKWVLVYEQVLRRPIFSIGHLGSIMATGISSGFIFGFDAIAAAIASSWACAAYSITTYSSSYICICLFISSSKVLDTVWYFKKFETIMKAIFLFAFLILSLLLISTALVFAFPIGSGILQSPLLPLSVLFLSLGPFILPDRFLPQVSAHTHPLFSKFPLSQFIVFHHCCQCIHGCSLLFREFPHKWQMSVSLFLYWFLLYHIGWWLLLSFFLVPDFGIFHSYSLGTEDLSVDCCDRFDFPNFCYFHNFGYFCNCVRHFYRYYCHSF